MLWFDSFEFDFHFLGFTFIVRNCVHHVDTTKKNKRKKDENQAQHNSKLQHKKKCFIQKLFTLKLLLK